MFYETRRCTTGLCSMEGPRKHTIHHGHQKCASGSSINNTSKAQWWPLLQARDDDKRDGHRAGLMMGE